MNELTATYQQNTTGIPEAFRTTETGSEKSPGKINGCFFQGLDYYPFGSLMPGRNLNANQYDFGYNGKLMDNEVFGITGSWYAYGERAYMPLIGRFPSPDPLIVKEQKYPELSPYQYASNRPIDGIDLDGLEYKKVIFYDPQQHPDGSWYYAKVKVDIDPDMKFKKPGEDNVTYAKTEVFYILNKGEPTGTNEVKDPSRTIVEKTAESNEGLKPQASYDYTIEENKEMMKDDFEYINKAKTGLGRLWRTLKVYWRNIGAPEDKEDDELMELIDTRNSHSFE